MHLRASSRSFVSSRFDDDFALQSNISRAPQVAILVFGVLLDAASQKNSTSKDWRRTSEPGAFTTLLEEGNFHDSPNLANSTQFVRFSSKL